MITALALALALLLAPLTASAASLTVGDREDILTSNKPNGWPDGSIGVLKAGSSYTFYAANGNGHSSPDGQPRRVTGTLDDPLANSEASLPIENLLDDFDYIGGGPVYKDASGLMLMFYHAEKWPGGNGKLFWASIGMAKSTDGGNTWTDLGLIITHQTPYNPKATYNAEIGSGAFIIKREKDGRDYFYSYFMNRLGNGADFNYANVSVARARVSDVVSAANAGTAPVFKKYCKASIGVGTFRGTCSATNRPWGEPGLGGLSSPLEPSNQDAIMATVSYNSYLKKYILLGNANQPNFDWPASDIIYLESKDGLQWSGRKILVGEDNRLAFYPTVIDPGPDPRITGSGFYVYYVYSTNPTPEGVSSGNLSRRFITVNRRGK
jgi:hypothetical protein